MIELKEIEYDGDVYNRPEEFVESVTFYFYISCYRKNLDNPPETDKEYRNLMPKFQQKASEESDKFFNFILRMAQKNDIYKGGRWEINENEDRIEVDYYYSMDSSVFFKHNSPEEFIDLLYCLYNTDYNDIVGANITINDKEYQIHELDELNEKLGVIN